MDLQGLDRVTGTGGGVATTAAAPSKDELQGRYEKLIETNEDDQDVLHGP